MTDLSKPIRRVTAARRHEKSKTRAVILSLEPPAQIGVRLQGTRQTFRLDAEAVYEIAVRSHENRIERLAKQLSKADGLPMRSARVKARKQMKEELR